VHCVPGEKVLTAAGGTGAVANGNEVERRPDVAEEPVVALTGEDLRSVAQVVHARHRERVIVRGRARPDVVGRGQQTVAHDARGIPVDAGDGVGLLRVLQERDGCLVLEPEPPCDVGFAVSVLVGIDDVARRGREGVPVGPRRRILPGDVVGDDGHRVGPVRAPERVRIRVVGRGVLRDQRCFPMARRLGGRRASAPRRERCEERPQGCGRQD